jgi:hypothetical protein
MVGKWLWLSIALIAVFLAMPASARTTHHEAVGCRHVAGALPAWYLDTSIGTYVTTVGAIPCRFTAVEPGGYATRGGSVVVTIERAGVTTVHRGRPGACEDGLIQPGDRVTVDALVVADAGAESGC